MEVWKGAAPTEEGNRRENKEDCTGWVFFCFGISEGKFDALIPEITSFIQFVFQIPLLHVARLINSTRPFEDDLCVSSPQHVSPCIYTCRRQIQNVEVLSLSFLLGLI